MNASVFQVRAVLLAMAIVIPMSFLAGAPDPNAKAPSVTHRLMEALPSRLQARLESRDRFRRALPGKVGGFAPAFVINVTKRWEAGQTVRVAFKSGNADIHAKIAEATEDWTSQANIKLDFGKQADGTYRKWSTTDKGFVAEVRISFDQSGYYSLVGTDSNNPAVTRPNEESMNFQGFDSQLPTDWRAVVLHEFGHALGFEHEHQHPDAGCDSDFRWQDDAGYVPTTDSFGQYIADPNGKRPGIYTVLGGEPNNWPKAVVDFNLKQLPESHAYEVGPFDSKSIMKYYFAAWMFNQGEASHCFSAGENLVLSTQDIVGIKKLYPSAPAQVKTLRAQRANILEALIKVEGLHPASQKNYKAQLEMMRIDK